MEKVEQEVERIIERPNSCEISVNAKGLWSGKVKVYGSTIDEAMDKAKEKALLLTTYIQERNV